MEWLRCAGSTVQHAFASETAASVCGKFTATSSCRAEPATKRCALCARLIARRADPPQINGEIGATWRRSTDPRDAVQREPDPGDAPASDAPSQK